MNKKYIITGFLMIAVHSMEAQISTASVNDFQDGTTQGWSVGTGTDPVNTAGTGPAGPGDNALQLTATGAGGPNSKLVIMNSDALWTGDWTSAGITYISLLANNTGSTSLTLRISLDGDGGRYSSTNGVLLPAGSGWSIINLPVSTTDFTAAGGADIAATLANVTTMRLIHSTTPSWQGTNIAATLLVDNIQAGNAPLPVTIAGFSARPSGTSVIISWEVLTAINSNYFEVERSSDARHWERAVFYSSLEPDTPGPCSVTDPTPLPGLSFYRLKQTDKDGSAGYSYVATVIRPLQATATAYPNPATDWVTVDLPGSGNRINVLSMAGVDCSRHIWLQRLSPGRLKIGLSALSPGIYLISNGQGNVQVIKK